MPAEQIYDQIRVSWKKPTADFESRCGPDAFGAQSRAGKVRGHAEKQHVAVAPGRKYARRFDSGQIDAGYGQIGRLANECGEADGIGGVCLHGTDSAQPKAVECAIAPD